MFTFSAAYLTVHPLVAGLSLTLGISIWLMAVLYRQLPPGNHRSKLRSQQKSSPLGLLEYAEDGVLLHDFKKTVDVNAKLIEILGHSRQELLEKPLKKWLELVHPKDYDHIRRIYSREHDGTYRVACFKADKSLIQVQIVAKNITVEHKAMRLIMVRDVTDQEADRAAIQRYRYIDDILSHSPFEVEPIIQIALDIAQRKTGASSVAIGLIDERSKTLTWKKEHYIGIPSFPLEPIPAESLDQEPERYVLIRHAIRSQQLLPNWQGPQHLHSILIPLVLDKQCLGLMVIDQPITNEYNQHLADFLKHLALRLAMRLAHAINGERLANYLSGIEILHQIDNTLAESRDYEAIIHVCTVGIQSLLESSSVAFYAYDEQKDLAVKQSEHKDSDEALPFPDEIRLNQFSALKYQLYHEEAVLLERDNKERSFFEQLRLEVRAVMLLPVQRDHRLIGFALVGEGHCQCEFDEHEIMLAKGVMTQTRFALERYQIIKSLHDSEQIKSEMIHMASHDLRSPLVQIHGYLELLRRAIPEPLSEDQQRYIANMERGIAKGRQLLDDILNLERVESQMPETWEDLQILTIIRSVLRDIEPRIALKEQHLVVDLPASLPWITGSDIQLQQMFMNLVDNAVKYTPDGGTITVRGWCEEHHFVFEVQDTGYGIPEEKVPMLFQRFFRAQVAGTESISGTGLGLSLVKAIAQRHNGTVFVTSRLGEGSSFGCRLPFTL